MFPLKTSFTAGYNWYFVVGDTIVFITRGSKYHRNSRQTVDSGQVEDTRWSEESSDVVKVNVFLLVVE